MNLYDYGELIEAGEIARLRGGPAPLPRRGDASARAPDPQRRGETDPGEGDETGRRGGRAAGRCPRGAAGVPEEDDADGAAEEESAPTGDQDGPVVIPVPAPEPRPGLDATFPASEIAVHLNLPSLERAAELRDLHLDAAAERQLGSGTPPLVERKPPIVPSRPLSYTAISAFEECAYRFYMERVLGLPAAVQSTALGRAPGSEGPSAREERSARGAAVHALLEWSQANEWREPTGELARRHALAAGLDLDGAAAEELLGPVRDWLSHRCVERSRRLRGCERRCRSCCAPARPSCAARSTCWSSATGRPAAGRRLQDGPPSRR